MSLKSTPKSFDLTCKKGYYLPVFKTASTLNYECSYPEPESYGAEFMSVDERAQFLEWYQDHTGKVLWTKDELLAYCIDEVNVLRQAPARLEFCF